MPRPAKARGILPEYFDKKDVINPWGKWNPEDFEVEDFAMGTIRFEGGLTVTLETAWASHIENITSITASKGKIYEKSIHTHSGGNNFYSMQRNR